MQPEIDERMIDLIAERVIASLRDDLEAILAELAAQRSMRPLTVEQVAQRFGVARSTVYAHWRDWGGYKLGDGPNDAIRFPAHALPQHAANAPEARTKRTSRRRRAGVLRGAPRFPSALDEPSRGTA